MAVALQKILADYKAGHFSAVTRHFSRPTDRAIRADQVLAMVVAQCFVRQDQNEDAAFWYEKAANAPGQASRHLRMLAAQLYMRIGQSAKVLTLTADLLKDDPRHFEALALRRECLRYHLMLDEVERSDQAVLAMELAGDAACLAMEKPLDHISWCADEAISAKLTRSEAKIPFTPESRARRRAMPHVFGDKIRVGYLSNDFFAPHATMRLFNQVLRLHDRSQFDITLYCHTGEAEIAVDDGLRSQLGRIVSVRDVDAAAAVAQMRGDGIDILVDLKGHTMNVRSDIINAGGAPIQVAYLGYPGTGVGLDCDYVIGDPVVLPDSAAPYYLEKIVRLPECYQPNDGLTRPLPAATRRSDHGLPEDRFVFASMNGRRKITAETARLWWSILRQVDRSVMWVYCDKPEAAHNLTDHAKRHGIDPARLIFTGPVAYADHISRLALADLALDTFPYNGHTTSSDLLWAGVPVATRKGSSFASRVSESLLLTLGIPELIARDSEDYVSLCVRLAIHPEALQTLRSRIVSQRFTSPLFDSARYTRHLEQAYRIMAERARAGLEPAAFDVPRLPLSPDPFRAL